MRVATCSRFSQTVRHVPFAPVRRPKLGRCAARVPKPLSTTGGRVSRGRRTPRRKCLAGTELRESRSSVDPSEIAPIQRLRRALHGAGGKGVQAANLPLGRSESCRRPGVEMFITTLTGGRDSQGAEPIAAKLGARQHHFAALQDRRHLDLARNPATTAVVEARRACKGEFRNEPLLGGTTGDAALMEDAGEQPATCPRTSRPSSPPPPPRVHWPVGRGSRSEPRCG